ncbi:Uncharacterised protein [Cedecea neteri]|uniref:Uncharacterized protein n=1 Tax=Cedecea neteri TaxID=158822 RepID=A0A2X3J1I0_9ENTR|nr:Uncharacterised protein [Cedecea neteri]
MLGRQVQFLQERELEVSTKAIWMHYKRCLQKNAGERQAQLERAALPESTMLSDVYLDARLKTLELRYQKNRTCWHKLGLMTS